MHCSLVEDKLIVLYFTECKQFCLLPLPFCLHKLHNNLQNQGMRFGVFDVSHNEPAISKLQTRYNLVVVALQRHSIGSCWNGMFVQADHVCLETKANDSRGRCVKLPANRLSGQRSGIASLPLGPSSNPVVALCGLGFHSILTACAFPGIIIRGFPPLQLFPLSSLHGVLGQYRD